MKAEDLKNSILQLAMEGKLVPQDPNDEPASVLLEKIREEKKKLIKEKKIKRNNKESFIFRKNGHFYEKIGEKGEPICIDNEIPFEIPKSWGCVRMGTFNEIARGGSPRPIKQYITEDSNGINWIKIGDTIKGDKYIYSTREKIKPEGIKKSRYVEEGDFLLTNSMSFGRPYILKTHGCIHDGWLVIKLNENLFYQDFMFYLLSSNFIFEQFSKLSAGSAVKNLKIDSVKKVFVPIPPLNEQKRIVKIIEEILPFIAEYSKYQEQLDKLNSEFPDKLKSSILQEAIQGKLVPQNPNDEPASVLLERIHEEKERLIKEKKIKRNNKESFIYKRNNHYYEITGKKGEPICIDDEIPFNIPDNWEWTRIKNIVTKLTDGAHKTPKYVDKGIPFLSVKDMSSGYLDFDDTKYISQEDFERIYQRCNYEYGDILLTKVGTTGIPIIIDTNEDFGLFVSVALLKFNHDIIYNKYLVHLINSPLVQLQCIENTKGVGNKNWVLRDIGNTLITIPPFNEQIHIVEKLEKIFQKLND